MAELMNDKGAAHLCVLIRVAFEFGKPGIKTSLENVDAEQTSDQSERSLTLEEMMEEVEIVFFEDVEEDADALKFYEKLATGFSFEWETISTEARGRSRNEILAEMANEQIIEEATAALTIPES